jgi:pyruvate/2-oxoglutarate dehydrogenase complex dihydrolipoamide dehydrogenase (E3) component
MRLLVVGGGSAGMAAALQARELGADVILLEADEVGGTTLNRGPAPVRTLARAARLARDWGSWETFGLRGPAPEPDLSKILARSEEVARHARDAKRLAAYLSRYGIDLTEHTGQVSFTGPRTLTAEDGRQWQGDSIILAVGGYAAPLPVPGSDLALTYDDIPSLTSLPSDVAIAGGADTGCQIASILSDFGVNVTIFEAGPLVRHRQTGGSGGDEDTTSFAAVFTAIGWPANINGLALDKAGVHATRAAIPVDQHLRTNVPHIFAAGDVKGQAKLVQFARAEGRIAARNAVAGAEEEATYRVVPSGSFTDPEYGQVGLTEAQASTQARTQARADGHDGDIVTATADYEHLLRPVADGRARGFCKLIVDRRDHTVVGGHVLGEYSAEIIQVIATAMTASMTVEQVAVIPFAFPTCTEAVGMAAQMICRDLGVGQFPRVWSLLDPAS